MRRLPAVMLALAACSCGPSFAAPPSQTTLASTDCTFDIIQPDHGATAKAFRAWLKPRADELVDGGDVDQNGDVYIADLDNNGSDELLFARHEGSGSYLYVWVFRGAGSSWSPVDNLPFDRQLELAHDYRGPMMNEPQLLARFCGKTTLIFQGGTEPNYYPVGLVWEGTDVTQLCSAPWLARHRRAAGDLVKQGMLDEARVLLDGVQRGCEKTAPAEWRAIQDDLAAIAARTASARADTYDFSWVKAAIKKDQDQQLVLDSRFDAMLIAIVPDAKMGSDSFRGALKKSVWLPDQPRVIDDRYLVISGCEPHNCGNKGFLWIDTTSHQAIAMTNGTLASRSTAADKIPVEFWRHTEEVVGKWADGTVEYLDGAGKTAVVKVP